MASLDYYRQNNCTVLVGNLYITDLPAEVTEDVLFEVLSPITAIHGEVHVENNPFLTSLSALVNVQEIHDMYLTNNPNLVDSRMPSLQSLRYNSAIVFSCPNLCPDRYTSLVYNTNSSGCHNLQIQAYYRFVGDLKMLPILQSSTANRVSSDPSFSVCDFTCEVFCSS